MPATPLTSYQMSSADQPGQVLADPTATGIDTTNGNTAVNSGATMFRLHNTDTAPHDVTFVTKAEEGGLPVADDPRTIPASSTKWVGRLGVAIYGANLTITCPSTLVQVTVFEP